MMVDNSIKVGFCVAYDWRFLTYALPLVYKYADVICLSLDKDHLSWAQRSFEWDQTGFERLITSIDISGKIIVYKDNFHLPELTAAENEIRQRKLMSEKMKNGGWHIQLDCDEYFLNFEGFVDFLKKLPSRLYSFNVCCQLITLFKEVNDGFLYVYPEKREQFDFFQIASRTPAYEHGRRNGNFNILSRFMIVHQSWARDEREILDKLSNWGHVDDFDVREYFAFWKDVDAATFSRVRNFHPIRPESWPTLRFIQSASVDNLILKFREAAFPTLNSFQRMLRNSITLSRFHRAFRLVYEKIFTRRPMK